MGIISGCRAVLHRLGTANQKANWLRQGKLSKREVLKYALSEDRELRSTIWETLNGDPALIVKLMRSEGFSSGVERLFRRPDAAPATIAKVFNGLISASYEPEEMQRAARIMKFHNIRAQGDILSELGSLNRALFENLRRLL